MTRSGACPFRHLTRHFFGGLFDFGVLSEGAADSFARMLVTTSGVLAAGGLLIARIYAGKYASMSAFGGPDEFQAAVVADHAFLMALPMWLVALVTVLAGHAVFPDETDFRVLMALPVTRRLVFGAKLLALGLFVGLVAMATHAALLPVVLLIAMAGWATHPAAVQVAAFVAASAPGALFGALGVVALQGVLVLFAPRRRLLTVSAALRSVMLGALVLSLPLIGRLPAQAHAIVQDRWWVYAAPPVWFVSLEQELLGGGLSAVLTVFAVLSLTVTGAAAAISYALLYRRFDRVMRPPAHGREPGRRLRHWAGLRAVSASRGVFLAVRAFTLVTLRRSVLHQGILVAIGALGAGLVLNSLIGVGVDAWKSADGPAHQEVVNTVTWAPFVLIFVVSCAVRASLAVPVEPRANWVFRALEQAAERREQLEAAARTVRDVGVLGPAVLMLPVQWTVMGPGAIACSGVAVVFGLLLVEFLMKNWARIPFTCSYVPGKRFVPLTLLLGVASFLAFTRGGAAIARASADASGHALLVVAVILLSVLMLRWRRGVRWRTAVLAFEDELPSDVNPLRLSD